MPERSVNASHWYDIDILRKKRFEPDQDVDALRARYFNQMSYIAWLGTRFGRDGAPTLIGEFGILCDLNGGEAFEAWARGERGEGVWTAHAQALSLMYDALDALQLSSTQWNYTASNRNDLHGSATAGIRRTCRSSRPTRPGDLGRNDPDAGARGLLGFCRPYAPLVQGRDPRDAPRRRRFEPTAEADPPSPSADRDTSLRNPLPERRRGGPGVLARPKPAGTAVEAAQTVRVWAVEAGPLRDRGGGEPERLLPHLNRSERRAPLPGEDTPPQREAGIQRGSPAQ